MEKPDVDGIDGIAPAIAIRQKNSIRNPRSTVGTTTEIHDYLRLLWARVGRTICRQCGSEVERESPDVVAAQLLALPEGTRLLIGFDHADRAHASMTPAAATPRATRRRTDERRRTADAGGAAGRRRPPPADPVARRRSARCGAAASAACCVDGRAVAIEEAAAAAATRSRSAPSLAVIVDRVKVAPDVARRG